MYQLNFSEGIANQQHKRTKTLFVFLLVLGLTIAPLAQVTANASVEYPYPAPTLLTPESGSTTNQTKPIIAGLSPNDSTIKIFIDELLNGQFQVVNHRSGTANFAYEPFLNLKPGWHQVNATATNNKGKESPRSETIKFFVEHPMPAPTMLQPVVNGQTTESRPWFVGLTVDNALVKIYIDGRWSGQLTVKDHVSGVVSFAYSTLFDITAGRHTAYAIAVDPSGKESQASNIVEFNIPDKKNINETTEQTTEEVKGEETINEDEATIENTEGSDNTNEESENATENDSESVTDCDGEEDCDVEETGDTNEDEDSNWPLIVGLMVLFVVLIIFIDNLVRKSRSGKSDSGSSSSDGKNSSDGSSKGESKKPTPDELFPPPPPDLK